MHESMMPVAANPGIRTVQRLLPAAIAGLVGGVVGFVLSRMAPEAVDSSEASLKSTTGVWFALIIVGIGAAIIGGQALADKRPPTGETMVIAAAALLVGGFISGYLAQSIYSSMIDQVAIQQCFEVSCYANEVRPARVVGWALAGCLGGAGVGASFRSSKRVQNGMLGGAIGGAIGGLLFDFVPIVFKTESDSLPQLIAIGLIGLFMGLLIGLIDTARTSMWLEVLNGEVRGKQYLVMEERTTVGSARTAQIRLIGDRQVTEIHMEIVQSPPSFIARSTGPVLVNGVQSTGGPLADGDVVQLGATQLRVGRRRAARAPAGAAYTQLPANVDHVSGGPRPRPTATQAMQGGPEAGGWQQRSPGVGNAPTPAPTNSAPTARPRLPLKPKQ